MGQERTVETCRETLDKAEYSQSSRSLGESVPGETSDKTLVLADTLTQPCESLSQGPSLAGPGALISRQSEIINVCGFQQLHVW